MSSLSTGSFNDLVWIGRDSRKAAPTTREEDDLVTVNRRMDVKRAFDIPGSKPPGLLSQPYRASSRAVRVYGYRCWACP